MMRREHQRTPPETAEEQQPLRQMPLFFAHEGMVEKVVPAHGKRIQEVV